MLILTIVTACLGIFGTIAAAIGITRILRDPRRIEAYAYTIVGLAATVLSIAVILYAHADYPLLLIITLSAMMGTLVIGNFIGYPLLTVLLLWAGITNLHRESRSLANMLALFAGIGLALLPATLALFEPSAVARDELAYHLQYGIHLGLLFLVAYVVFCFAAFAVAALAYRWRKIRLGSEAIIILGSGLIDGKVPPLLAGRLQRGIKAQRDDAGQPSIITSGGQGDDESRAEGAAMREYLIEHGVAPDRVVAEEHSTSTEENLVFSQELLPKTTSAVTVVTSSYHVLRAALLTRALGLRAQIVGAPTAWYYLPGAVLREFAAVMRDHVRIHLVAVTAIIVLTMAFTSWIVPAIVVPAGAL